MGKLKLIWLFIFLSGISLSAITFNSKTSDGWKINYDLNIEEPQNIEFLVKHSIIPKNNSSYEIFIYEKLSEKKEGQQILRYKPDVHNLEPIKFNAALRKGQYIIKLHSSQYYDMPFDFKINSKTTGNFEQEPNNSFSEANQIEEKYFYTGFMARRDGVQPSDYYKLIMPEDGEMKIVFQTEEICAEESRIYKNCYEITLYAGSLSEKNHERVNNPLFKFQSFQKEEERIIGLPKGEYYLRIHGKRGNLEKDTNRPYKIAYLTTLTQYTELEPNDSIKTATALTPGKYYTAEMQEKYSEVDYFSFEIPQKQTVTIAFKFKNNKRFGRGISLYNENEKWITDFSLKEEDNEKQFEAILDKGKYFLMVRYEKGTQYLIGTILSKTDSVELISVEDNEKSAIEKSFLEKLEEQKRVFDE